MYVEYALIHTFLKRTHRSFATCVTTQNLAFLSYWYRKKLLQMHF